MKIRCVAFSAAILVLATACCAQNVQDTSLDAWVIDSACAYTKNLAKPVNPTCAKECGKRGSPLVLLTNEGNILLPIDGAVPAQSQNTKLLPFAGQRVHVSGRVLERKGSKAIVISTIEPAPSPK